MRSELKSFRVNWIPNCLVVMVFVCYAIFLYGKMILCISFSL
jgi:hypothetical protein